MKSLQLSSLLLMLFFEYCNAQSLPDYWSGKISTSKNATMLNQVPFKIFGSNKEYNKEDSPRDFELQLGIGNRTSGIAQSKRNPTNEPPVNETGTTHKVTLTNGLITAMKVIDHYNYDGTGTTPVEISTSWLKVDEAKSIDHNPFYLEQAVNDGTLLNFTIHSSWFLITPEQTQKIAKERYWEIDEYLCYYAGTTVEVRNGKCVLPYNEVIQYFIELWQLGFVNKRANANRDQVSNNYDFLKDTYKCAFIPGEKTCEDNSLEQIEYIPDTEVWLPPIFKWYRYDAKPAGIGYAVNFTFGYNKHKGAYDLNFTGIFNEWTYDLPEGLLSSFRDYKFNFEDFEFELFYWKKDPVPVPERPPPDSFLIMCIIMIFPTSVLIVAMFFLLLNRTKKVFNVKVWEYWKLVKTKNLTKKRLEKMKEDKLLEMAEVRKLKEYENYASELDNKKEEEAELNLKEA